jgi:hypothetical protein
MYAISNIGMVDGRLHMLVRVDMDKEAYRGGYFITFDFVNEDGETVYRQGLTRLIKKVVELPDEADRGDKTAKTADDYESGEIEYDYGEIRHSDYIEIIYDDINDADQMKDLSVIFEYKKPSTYIKGYWELPFSTPGKKTADVYVGREIEINGRKTMIETISISPLGLTIHMPYYLSGGYKHEDDVSIVYGDGAIEVLDQSSIHSTQQVSTLVFSGEVIEVEKAVGIIINGDIINIA